MKIEQTTKAHQRTLEGQSLSFYFFAAWAALIVEIKKIKKSREDRSTTTTVV